MQFALLLYDNESFHEKSESDQQTIIAEHMAFSESLQKSGALVSGEPLETSSTAKTVRASGLVEDGPYADTKEQLGGFYVIDVDDMSAAIEWARKCPALKDNGSVEVRAVPNYAGE